MPRFKFIQKRAIDRGTGFVQPNEDLGTLRSLLPPSTLTKTAAICSGGEVPLTLLLPISQEVVAVDHAATSLAWAYCKALMMEKLSGDAIKKLFLFEALHILDLFRELEPEVPDALRGKGPFKRLDGWPNYLGPLWLTIPTYSIDQAREKLDSLTMIHGDLRDLDGEFDLFYSSNAHCGHAGHDGRSPTYNDYAKIVRHGGHVLATAYNPHRTDNRWKLVSQKRFKEGRGQIMSDWCYQLHEKVGESK